MLHFLHTEAGDNHKNEDVIVVHPHPDDENMLLCVLADGQGGQSGGGRAAQLAAEQCLQEASRFPPRALLDAIAWEEIFTATDAAVLGDRDAGYTTLVSLCDTGTRIWRLLVYE